MRPDVATYGYGRTDEVSETEIEIGAESMARECHL